MSKTEAIDVRSTASGNTNIDVQVETVSNCRVWTGVPDEYGNLEVLEKDEVNLPCHATPSDTTNVSWNHTHNVDHGAPLLYDIYVNGQIYDGLQYRFSIHNAAVGDYSLQILNVHPDDAGVYRCFNRQQLLKRYVIYVNPYSEYSFIWDVSYVQITSQL